MSYSTLESWSDYYPFGWKQPGRSLESAEGYRYGYQGQFAEEDDETGWNQFELRMYDGRVGRWMSTDPLGQFYSPYLALHNNPIIHVDSEGGFSKFYDPPHIFFRGYELNRQTYGLALYDQSQGNIHHTIRIYAHGGVNQLTGETTLYYYENNGNVQRKIKTVTQFNKIMMRESQDWRDYKAGKINDLRIELISCNAGGNALSSNSKYASRVLAAKISKAYPDVEILAPTNLLKIDGGKYSKTYANNDYNTEPDINWVPESWYYEIMNGGSWNIFKGGQIWKQAKPDYWTPSGRDGYGPGGSFGGGKGSGFGFLNINPQSLPEPPK